MPRYSRHRDADRADDLPPPKLTRQSLWFAEVGERTLAALRQDSYARLICLPMAFYSQRRVGELTSRIAADLALIQDTLIGSLPHLLRQVTILTGGVALIALTSGRL